MGAWDCSDRCTPGEYVATYSVRQKYASVHTPTVACVLHSMRVGVTRAAAHPVASLPGACARGDRLPLRGTGPLAPLRNYKKEKNINVTTHTIELAHARIWAHGARWSLETMVLTTAIYPER
jgi:hypothetical protein